MAPDTSILKELSEISPFVAGIPPVNLYSLQPGYFEDLPGEIIRRITLEGTDGAKPTPYHVPQGYFEALPGNILGKIKQSASDEAVQVQTVEEELNQLAPLLNTISKQPVYTVPGGYFESLELTIPLKLDKPAAGVFRFGQTRRILQYAVAACVVAVLAIGGYMYVNDNTAGEMPISHKEAVNMDVADELADVNEQEISAYLEQSPIVGYAVNTIAEDFDMMEFLDATSDDEIEQYLDETSYPGETLTSETLTSES